jgi:hypothetical protein
MVQFLASNTFVTNPPKIKMQGLVGRDRATAEAGRALTKTEAFP